VARGTHYNKRMTSTNSWWTVGCAGATRCNDARGDGLFSLGACSPLTSLSPIVTRCYRAAPYGDLRYATFHTLRSWFATPGILYDLYRQVWTPGATPDKRPTTRYHATCCASAGRWAMLYLFS